MSILPMSQLRTISSAASCGMMPSRPWTMASARSIARYLAVRFSSDHTWRMASLLKMLPKMRESMMVAPMASLLLAVEMVVVVVHRITAVASIVSQPS